jgi:cytochrome c
VLLSLVSVSFVAADQADDCVRLVGKAIAMFKEMGREATLKAINDPKGPFVEGDLYLFALTMDNVLVGQPHQRLLRRMNLSKTQDSSGVYFFAKFKEIAQDPGQGWVKYSWAKPGEKDASPKRSFIKRVPGENLYVGAGYYPK